MFLDGQTTVGVSRHALAFDDNMQEVRSRS
jgi:hypothetical protein